MQNLSHHGKDCQRCLFPVAEARENERDQEEATNPRHPHTKVPKLDPTVQSRMTPAAKNSRQRLQGFVLDAVVPLVNMLESAKVKPSIQRTQQSLCNKL